MIELLNNKLEVSFPEVHPDAACTVDFQRTLRVPDDNQDYPLPAGLGSFPLLPVDDYATSPEWKLRGGVFLPMYQSEAMWINFGAGRHGYPFAIKVAAGKVNAITGEPWSNELSDAPQDYVVITAQPWLDGFSVSKDIVRQFVAMPLGEGVTAEEQLTGEAVWGGLQLIFYPMKGSEYLKRFIGDREASYDLSPECYLAGAVDAMGLAPGGRICQEIATDPYGIDVWDTSVSSRCFVHLLNSRAYQAVTGNAPPTAPITSEQYAKLGVPWFAYYHDGATVGGSSTLAKMDSVAAALQKKDAKLSDNKPITISKTIHIPAPPIFVREGKPSEWNPKPHDTTRSPSMETVQLSVRRDIFEKLQELAIPLKDDANSVLERLLSYWHEHRAISSPPQTKPTSPKPALWYTARGEAFRIGMDMRARYLDKTYFAKVTASGIEFNGKLYDSPSTAGIAVKEYAGTTGSAASTNGWEFWEMYDWTEKRWVSINVLRSQTTQ